MKHIVIASILGWSSLAVADSAASGDKARMWTIEAASNHATKGNLDNKKQVDDPGVLVTKQRDPHAKK